MGKTKRRFKNSGMMHVEKPGSEEWCLKLLEFMGQSDDEVALSDIQRWVAFHPWITSDYEPRQVRAKNYQAHEPSTYCQPFTPAAKWATLNSAEQLILNEPSNGGNTSGRSQEPTRVNTSLVEYPSADSLIQASSSEQQFPTTSSATRSFVDPPYTSFQQNSSPYDLSQDETTSIIAAKIHDQKLMEEYFRTAFNAINLLHEICGQMPQVRTCLLPLKDIHRCFVRSHANFVFPQEYRTIRSRDEEARRVMKREQAQVEYDHPTQVITLDNDCM